MDDFFLGNFIVNVVWLLTLDSLLICSYRYFSAAKNDVQAVRLLVALSGADANATQEHGTGPRSLANALARPLARLMSKPTIEHQLRFLRLVNPRLFAQSQCAICACVGE